MKLRIEAVAVGDPYARSYGLGVDQGLDIDFWTTQPHKVRKIVSPPSFVDEVEVPDATKYVVVGISAYVGRWHVKVYKNSELAGEGDVAVPDAYPESPGYLHATLAPPMDMWALPLIIAAGAPLMFVGGIVAMQEAKIHVG